MKELEDEKTNHPNETEVECKNIGETTYLDESDMTLSGALRLSLPLVATSFVFCLIGAVDMTIAGWQSAAAQAAVGIADQCIFATMLIGTGLAAATGCFVSQSLGANHPSRARQYAIDGLLLSLCIGILASISCYVGASALIEFSGCTMATKLVALPYLQTCAFGNLPFTIVLVQAAILRSMGHTSQCLKLWSLIGIISVGGGLYLFYSNETTMTTSLTSLAVAWDIGAVAGVGLATHFLRKKLFNRNLVMESGQYMARLKKFCSVGVPVLLSEACCLLSLAAIYALLGRLPDSERLQAAYTVALKIEETFGILPLLALSTVCATLVGHQIGARKFIQARRLGWQLTLAAALGMLICGSVIGNSGLPLGAFFTADASVLKQVFISTAQANISLPLIAISSILFAALEGAGETNLSLIAQFTGYILCRLPLAYFFAVTLEFGYSGIWLAIVISRLVVGIQSLIMYRTKFSGYTTARLVESKSTPNSAK
ncbi:MAG: MATE family efflux transporter [Candidatus Obscuribacterales bacterium]